MKEVLRNEIDLTKVQSRSFRQLIQKVLEDHNKHIDWQALVEYIDGLLMDLERERFFTEHTLKTMSQDMHESNIRLQQQKEELERSSRRYKLALIATNDGLFEWDLQTNRFFASKRWLEMIYIDEEEGDHFSIEDWYDRIHPSHVDQIRKTMKDHVSGVCDHVDIEYQIRTDAGYYIWVELRTVSYKNQEGRVVQIVGAQTDVTVRHENEKALYQAAFHDELTGLPNRSLFLNRLKQVIKREGRLGEKPACVLFVDIDRFKFTNDTFGYEFGDKVLLVISEILRNNIRPADTVARLGGDEFTVLLNEVEGVDEAIHIANRILKRVNRIYEIDGREVHLATSIGLTMIDRGALNASLILRNADVAMYQAKTKGRGRLEIFDQHHHKIIADRVRLEAELRVALRKNQFEAYFQPLVTLATGEISSFEALVRWDHPERGFISPGSFVPVAEDIGLIAEIGAVVMEESFQFIESIHKVIKGQKGPLVAVNLSVRQLMDDHNFDQVLNQIKKHKKLIPNLRLEVTEGLIIQEPELARERLNILKELGISIALDDFGTGYSSLGYLNKFPFDVIKIDQGFTAAMPIDDKAYTLVKGIMSMAHGLGLETVAEGIETVQQMKMMRDLECTYGQGYLIARALQKRDALALISQEKNFQIEVLQAREYAQA